MGFAGIWYSQCFFNISWFVKASTNKIRDIFIQDWFATIDIASSSNICRLFKTKFEQSEYVSVLSSYLCKQFLAFRLPVEVGRWKGVPLQERMCMYCNRDIGDEFHYILSCDHFQEHISKYIPRFYYKNPNIIKFEQLMSISTTQTKQIMYIYRYYHEISQYMLVNIVYLKYSYENIFRFVRKEVNKVCYHVHFNI